jgi:hypothetical protein
MLHRHFAKVSVKGIGKARKGRKREDRKGQ